MCRGAKWPFSGYAFSVAKHRATNLLRESKNPLPLIEETEWFRERVLEWAAEHGRDFPWRHSDDEYQIVVTEILLQQTTATAVSKLWHGFFDRFPTWRSLYQANASDLGTTLQGLGLVNQRTRRLKQLAAWVAEHNWHLPATREALEAIPGIGQYVASALLAVKYGQPEPLLDVNMARVLERFFGVRELADIRDDPWLQAVARRTAARPAEGWATLDLAATACVGRNPQCGNCPVWQRCTLINGPKQ